MCSRGMTRACLASSTTVAQAPLAEPARQVPRNWTLRVGLDVADDGPPRKGSNRLDVVPQRLVSRPDEPGVQPPMRARAATRHRKVARTLQSNASLQPPLPLPEQSCTPTKGSTLASAR